MKFTFLSLFPELIKPYFDASIMARAVKNNIIKNDFVNPRDFSQNRLKSVDEYLLGGGAGLLMMPEPLSLSLEHIMINNKDTHFIFLSPVGKKFNQADAKRLSKKNHICFVCGRYEGIDERIIELYANEIFSIGDFVLTGGEIASLCLADAISRNLDGVLGNSNSLMEESFETDMLEAPSFTKPNIFRNISVVSEFLKGNHAKISTLKNEMACYKTKFFRPDLYQKLKTNMKD